MSTLVEVVVTLVWACLQVPGAQNQLFAQLFFAINVVTDLAATASLTFCPGLQEALDGESPPEVSWFKHLPADYKGKWGVYVLVFKKDDYVPHLYCGSATDSRLGISSRWALYDKHNIRLRENVDGLPSGVLKAFQAGFKITHKGLLVTAPIPSAANVPMLRLLFYGMEATFSFAFWMMSSTKHYAYHTCCRWSPADFTYKGLCSHSALHDPVAGRFDLSSEELTLLAADVKERERAYQKAYRLARIAEDEEGFKAQKKQHLATFRENNLERARAIKARSQKKSWASDKYNCDICGTKCKSEWEHKRHNESSNHKINVRKAEAGVDKPFKCTICGYSTEVKGSMKRHKDGKIHKGKVRALQEALEASSSSS